MTCNSFMDHSVKTN